MQRPEFANQAGLASEPRPLPLTLATCHCRAVVHHKGCRAGAERGEVVEVVAAAGRTKLLAFDRIDDLKGAAAQRGHAQLAYRVSIAQRKAELMSKRPKTAVLASNDRLRDYV